MHRLFYRYKAIFINREQKKEKVKVTQYWYLYIIMTKIEDRYTDIDYRLIRSIVQS